MQPVANRPGHTSADSAISLSSAVSLAEMADQPQDRFMLKSSEFARVLGGGIVPGSLILIGGDPGIGKSTLLLQIALDFSERGKVLYISGEESIEQVRARAARLEHQQRRQESLLLATETELGAVLAHIEETEPQLVIIDSIQTMRANSIDGAVGSLAQVRESAAVLQRRAKTSGTAIFLVGHVTKEGAIAGPKALEHIVDTVLYLEGDPYHAYRLLRSEKNRFGATTEIGVFEMTSTGMREVSNPSQAFLEGRAEGAAGSAIAVIMEGTRPLLVEVQALTSQTSFGHPRRTANGIELNRMLLLIAVLSRRANLKLESHDIFANVVGGLRVREPAVDLSLATAIASSYLDKPIPADLALVGEIGLSGELRPVSQIEARLKEAAKFGMKQAIIPASNKLVDEVPAKMEVRKLATLVEVVRNILQS
jgi:DNA repair protein RadA/Sms